MGSARCCQTVPVTSLRLGLLLKSLKRNELLHCSGWLQNLPARAWCRGTVLMNLVPQKELKGYRIDFILPVEVFRRDSSKFLSLNFNKTWSWNSAGRVLPPLQIKFDLKNAVLKYIPPDKDMDSVTVLLRRTAIMAFHVKQGPYEQMNSLGCSDIGGLWDEAKKFGRTWSLKKTL